VGLTLKKRKKWRLFHRTIISTHARVQIPPGPPSKIGEKVNISQQLQ